ncbi:peptide deformylase [Tundrisphaera sp. TA3]|uniref:peptide deformylase n=1 Tax=Tundrisphaera sp. TA3 TaxID=3435775 RepID=UPI003EBAD12F
MPNFLEIAELGEPVLRAPTGPVAAPADDSLRAFAADLMATMERSQGVGIAAPQVYRSDRIFIVATRPNPRYPDAPTMEPTIVLNPEIIERSDEIVAGWEGCLSIPGIRGLVPRPRRIVARYQTLDGEVVEREFVDFPARVFQHEDDHLRGIVFLDRLASNRDIITEKEYRKMVAG